MIRTLFTFFALLTVAQQCNAAMTTRASALYWLASENVDWSYTTLIDGDTETISYNTLSFDWEPGFKIGIGYLFDCTQWDTQLEYTWFRSRVHAETTGSISSAFLGSKTALYNFYETAGLDWDLNVNLIEWGVGRSCWTGNCFSLRPSIGLVGGWISQSAQTVWTNPIVDNLIRVNLTATEDLKNNFTGLGPVAGIDFHWLITNYFNLVARFSTAYLWGYWSIEDHFHGGATSVSVQLDNRNFGAIAFRGLIGLRWEGCLCACNAYLEAGYELQDWLNQYQIFDNATGAHNNDLILQGLTVTGGICF